MRRRYLVIVLFVLLIFGGCTKKEQSKFMEGEAETVEMLGREIYDCGISLNNYLNDEFFILEDQIYFSALERGYDGKLRLSIYRGDAFSDEFFVDTGLSTEYSTDMLWLIRHTPDKSNGSIYLLQNDHDEHILIEEYKDNGKLMEFINIPCEDIPERHITSFTMNNEGMVLVLADQAMYGYYSIDEVVSFEKPQTGSILKVFSVAEKMYCLVNDVTVTGEACLKIYLFHSDGNIEKSIIIPKNSIAITPLNGELAFFVEDSGIYTIDPFLSTCEKVVDLSREKKIWEKVEAIVKKDNKYGFLYRSLADQACRTMVFNNSMIRDENTIELKLYDPTGYIKNHCPAKIIDSFNEIHPEYHVSVMEEKRDLEYVLLSDIQPDLIILNEENMCLLGKEGYLEDLSTYLKMDDSDLQEEFLDGLLDKIAFEEKIFGLPKKIKIRTMCAKTSKVSDQAGWKTEEFLDWMIDHPEALKDSWMIRSMLLQYCLEGGMDDYIDFNNGECYFNGDDFARHLKKISEIKEYYVEGASSSETGELRYIGVEGLRSLLMREDFEDPWVYKGLPTFDGRERHNLVFDAMSILKTSRNKEAAYAFLQYYIRYRYWDDFYLYTDKPLFQKITEIEKKNYLEVGANNDLMAVGQKEIDCFRELYEHSEMCNINSWEIMGIILGEANEYLEGKRELEEVTEHIQSRVQLLLKENK